LVSLSYLKIDYIFYIHNIGTTATPINNDLQIFLHSHSLQQINLNQDLRDVRIGWIFLIIYKIARIEVVDAFCAGLKQTGAELPYSLFDENN